MSNSDLAAQIEAATAYDNFFLPALFAEWAPRVADTARIQPGQRVLDVACGTGVLAREALKRTGNKGFVAGLDPDLGMLAVAAQHEPGIEWRLGTAETLPYPDESFDAVISQFGLMYFSDKVGAIREMLRVLAPGGQLAVAVWDSLERIPAYAAEAMVLEGFAGQPAADALRSPFALGDPEALVALFISAGAGRVAIASHPGKARFPSVRAMVEADILGWLPLVGVSLSDEQIREVLEEAEQAIEPHVTSGSGITFDAPAHIVTAGKP